MIERLELEDWIAFDARHPAPTFFARPAWALALAQTHDNMRPVLLRIQRARNRAILLPLMRVHGGALRWREYRGFPLGGYTCFMHEDDGSLASSRECTNALAELERFADAATVIPWPLGPVPECPARIPHETSVLDLSHGVDAAMANVEGIFRRMAGQATRRGVVCAPANEPDALDRYYAILEDSARRWGLDRPTISRELIAALTANGGRDVEIWFARADGRDIAGGIVFYGSQEFFFWSAAMLAEFGRLRPSNALNFALIHAAASRGMRWYNLGSSEGLPGVAKFKRDLGTTDVRYDELQLTRAHFRLYAAVKRALVSHAVV